MLLSFYPNLEYVAIVWDICAQELSDLIETVQYRDGHIVSGAIHRTSAKLIYTELGWVRLKYILGKD